MDYEQESTAVRYWKREVRHWQNIAILGFFAGMIVGIGTAMAIGYFL